MHWINFFHLYQPAGQRTDILKRVAEESYGPLAAFLLAHPDIRVTMNIAGALTDQLNENGFRDILTSMHTLVTRGQVELVGTAKYHVILPLIADQASRQISLNTDALRRAFGNDYHPTGFFSPEMCYSREVEQAVATSGYTWMILDEIALDGSPSKVDFSIRYRSPSTNMRYLFRNRTLSNFLSFVTAVDDPRPFWDAVKRDGRSSVYLVTAMDGENLGHHRKGVDKLWQTLVTDTRIATLTVSEYLDALIVETPCSPRPCSWSTEMFEIESGIPYGLWNHPDNPLHALQWQLTRSVIGAVETATSRQDSGYQEAQGKVDRALASDQYWWASAHPWWSKEYVVDATQRLADAITPLVSCDAPTRKNIEQLKEKILQTASAWQDHKEYVQRQKAFTSRSTITPYLGGAPVGHYPTHN